MTHWELEDDTYNIEFAADAQRALMNSLYAVSLKASALILLSGVHYLPPSSSLIYLFAYFLRDVIRWISLHCGNPPRSPLPPTHSRTHKRKISSCFWRNVNIAERRREDKWLWWVSAAITARYNQPFLGNIASNMELTHCWELIVCTQLENLSAITKALQPFRVISMLCRLKKTRDRPSGCSEAMQADL